MRVSSLIAIPHLGPYTWPSLLDDLGLVPALRWHVERFARRLGIQAELVLFLSDSQLDKPHFGYVAPGTDAGLSGFTAPT